jgi:hypothetical protein
MSARDDAIKAYAKLVRSALEQDQFTRSASITESKMRSSVTARILKEIDSDVRTWRVEAENRPVNERERDKILLEVGQALGLEKPQEFVISVKAASNDAYVELVHHVGGLLRK